MSPQTQSMDEQVKRLVDKTWNTLESLSPSSRLLIAIAGIPGSGKTTFAQTVVSSLNELHHAQFHSRYPNSPTSSPNQPDIACAVPLDGFHLTRAQLAAMPNAEEAIFRRGAPFTFDASAYHKLVDKLRKPIEPGTKTIYAPSFDHAVKDPVDDDIAIPPQRRIVVFEGNYTALDDEVWRDAAGLMDELWFVEVGIDTAVARLVKRHVAAGIADNTDQARERVVQSDMRNGREVVEKRLQVHEVVWSVEDEDWKSRDVKRVEERGDVDVHADEANAGEDGDKDNERPRTLRLGSLAEMADSGVGL